MKKHYNKFIFLVLLLHPILVASQADTNEFDNYNSISFEELRDKVVIYLWNDKIDSLKNLCQDYPVETFLFIEKCINDIQPNKQENQALYFTAKKLLEVDSSLTDFYLSIELKEKELFIKDTSLDKSVLKPYIANKFTGDDLTIEEFNELIDIIISFDFYEKFGLSELVKKNPTSTKSFVNSIIINFDTLNTESKLFNVICWLGLYYQNFHFSRELLTLINDKYGGVSAFIDINNNDYSIKLMTGGNMPDDFFKEKLLEIEILLSDLKYDKALLAIKKYTKYADYIIRDELDIGPALKEGKSPFHSLFLFYALIEIRLNNIDNSIHILRDHMNKGYGYEYPWIILGSAENIYSLKKQIDKIFEYRRDSLYYFDDFMYALSGKYFSPLVGQLNSYFYDLLEVASEIEQGANYSKKLMLFQESSLDLLDSFNDYHDSIITLSEIEKTITETYISNTSLYSSAIREYEKEYGVRAVVDYYIKLNCYRLLSEYFFQLNRDSVSTDDIAYIQTILGFGFLTKKDVNTANTFFQEACQNYSIDNVAKNSYELILAVNCCSKASKSYLEANNFNESLESIRKSESFMVILLIEKDTSAFLKRLIDEHYSFLDSLALDYLDFNKPDIAIECLNYCLEYQESIHDSSNIAVVYNNLGKAYKLKKEFQTAESYLNQAIQIAELIDFEIVLAYSYGHLCEVKLKLNKQEEGLVYGLESLKLCVKHNLIKRGCETLSILNDIAAEKISKEDEMQIYNSRKIFLCN